MLNDEMTVDVALCCNHIKIDCGDTTTGYAYITACDYDLIGSFDGIYDGNDVCRR